MSSRVRFALLIKRLPCGHEAQRTLQITYGFPMIALAFTARIIRLAKETLTRVLGIQPVIVKVW